MTDYTVTVPCSARLTLPDTSHSRTTRYPGIWDKQDEKATALVKDYVGTVFEGWYDNPYGTHPQFAGPDAKYPPYIPKVHGPGSNLCHGRGGLQFILPFQEAMRLLRLVYPGKKHRIDSDHEMGGDGPYLNVHKKGKDGYWRPVNGLWYVEYRHTEGSMFLAVVPTMCENFRFELVES